MRDRDAEREKERHADIQSKCIPTHRERIGQKMVWQLSKLGRPGSGINVVVDQTEVNPLTTAALFNEYNTIYIHMMTFPRTFQH